MSEAELGWMVAAVLLLAGSGLVVFVVVRLMVGVSCGGW